MYGTVPIFLKTLHFFKFNQQVLNKNKKIVNKAKQSEFSKNKFSIRMKLKRILIFLVASSAYSFNALFLRQNMIFFHFVYLHNVSSLVLYH